MPWMYAQALGFKILPDFVSLSCFKPHSAESWTRTAFFRGQRQRGDRDSPDSRHYNGIGDCYRPAMEYWKLLFAPLGILYIVCSHMTGGTRSTRRWEGHFEDYDELLFGTFSSSILEVCQTDFSGDLFFP